MQEVIPFVIDDALKGWKIAMRIADADARISTFACDFFNRLAAFGYGLFRDKNVKVTIKLLLQRVEPPQLRTEMSRRLKYDESLERDLKKFV